MKLALVCLVAGAAAVAPPRIELNLDQNDPLNTQDYMQRCTVHQSITECPFPVAKAWDHVNKDISHRIRTRVYKARDGDVTCSADDGCIVDTVSFDDRATYIFKYDVSDYAGNPAQQVTYTLEIDDRCQDSTPAGTSAPCNPQISFGTCEIADTWQAAESYQMCQLAVATDNEDDAATMASNLWYKIVRKDTAGDNLMCANDGEDFEAHDAEKSHGGWWSYKYYKDFLAGDSAIDCLADENQGNAACPCALRGLRSKIVGRYEITWKACDEAGYYGHNSRDNCVTATTTVVIDDTTDPVIQVHGNTPDVIECRTACKDKDHNDDAQCYQDGGSTVTDSLDTAALGKTIEAVTDITTSNPDQATLTGYHYLEGEDGSWMGDHTPYVLHYNAMDDAQNNATQVTRDVYVVDRLAPTAHLVGNAGNDECVGTDCATIEHVSEQEPVTHPADPGATCTDLCDTSTSAMLEPHTAENNYGWGPKAWDEMKPGTYVRTYICTDASGNSNEITRTFINQDKRVPVIKINGAQTETQTATNTEEYTDEGATCSDTIDGEISHAIEVSGDVVNLKVPGSYVIQYDCMDISDNEATPIKRTVTVEDKSCPNITMLGEQFVYVEAGFKYTDAGAEAEDDLDGDISNKIVKQGDTVNYAQAFYSQPSCKAIKEAYPGANDGNYHITTYNSITHQWQRVEVYCSMSTAQPITAYSCEGCKAVHSYSDADGDCTAKGLVMLSKAHKDVLDANLGALFKAKWANSAETSIVTDMYLCGTSDENGGASSESHLMNSGMEHLFTENQISQAEEGKYVISYHVTDSSNNPECETKYRTVIVRDTLPPVLSLHHKWKTGTANSQGAIWVGKSGERGIHAVDGTWREGDDVNTPKWDGIAPDQADWDQVAALASSSTLMAEGTSSSVNGWLIAAAASAVAGVALLSYSARKSAAIDV